jgi:hypothetical protein
MTAASTTTTPTLSPVLATTPPDPTKHVNYTLGMVLGVDDFDQEFAYLSGRDQWLARDVLGYGTVRGLRVQVVDDPTQGPEVIVDPGIALTPDGNVARVKVAQCAFLNSWLGANQASVGGGTSVTLYVVISYQSTPTDMVPIPGEPCRSEDDASAPSRLADDFQIQLVTAPPAQAELSGRRALLAWLDAVQVVDTGGAGKAAFLSSLRNSVPLTTAGSSTPPPPYLTLPSPPIQVNAADVPDFWRAALGVYVTELRANDLALPGTPATPPVSWLDAGQTPVGDPPTDARLVLGKLIVPLNQGASGPSVAGGANNVVVDSLARPLLIPLDVLESMLVSASAAAAPAASYRVIAAGAVPIQSPTSTSASSSSSSASNSSSSSSGASPPAATTYGNLSAATTVAPGQVLVTFSGTGPEDPPNLQYVIKAMVFSPSPGLASSSSSSSHASSSSSSSHSTGGGSVGSWSIDPVVSLTSLPVVPVPAPAMPNPRSFTLQVGTVGTAIPPGLSLMIEISAYFAA